MTNTSNTATVGSADFIGYEYKNISVPTAIESLYVDSYRAFGWALESSNPDYLTKKTDLKFKRDRQISNKAELSRLQRQFDSYADRVASLLAGPAMRASVISIILGVLGCAFLAGATFSYLAGLTVFMVVFAVPGFILWIVAYPVYRQVRSSGQHNAEPQIDAAYDSIYETTKKASQLL